jgi:tRNA pseudouridine38-40 synthase
VWPQPDVEKLESCAKLFIGEHDFSAFGTPPKEGGVTIRQVFESGWQELNNGLIYEVRANAFLYHMVRRMVNIQVEVAQGRLEVSEATAYLQGRVGEMVPGLAPPHGLSLVEVKYSEKNLETDRNY